VLVLKGSWTFAKYTRVDVI